MRYDCHGIAVMPYEIGMYAILTGIWAVLYIVPGIRLRAFKITIVGCATVAVILFLLCHLYMIPEGKFLRLFVMFFSGATAFAVKDLIVLSRSVFLSLLVLIPLLSVFGEQVLFYAYVLALPYILLYLAYIPSGLVSTIKLEIIHMASTFMRGLFSNQSHHFFLVSPFGLC